MNLQSRCIHRTGRRSGPLSAALQSGFHPIELAFAKPKSVPPRDASPHLRAGVRPTHAGESESRVGLIWRLSRHEFRNYTDPVVEAIEIGKIADIANLDAESMKTTKNDAWSQK